MPPSTRMTEPVMGGALAGEEGYNVGVLFRFAVPAEWDCALTLSGNFFDAASFALGFCNI